MRIIFLADQEVVKMVEFVGGQVGVGGDGVDGVEAEEGASVGEILRL